MEGAIERKVVDNQYRRKQFKIKHFGGKRSAIDEYTGNRVFFAARGVGAQKGSSRHFTTGTTANQDHIIPIDVIIKRYGNRLTPEQMRMIANSDYNLAIINEALNKSKGNLQNHQYLIRQWMKGDPENLKTTYLMLKRQVTSEVRTGVDASVMQISNITDEVTAKVTEVLDSVPEKLTRTPEATSASVSHVPMNELIVELHGKGIESAQLAAATTAGRSLGKKITTLAKGEIELPEAALSLGIDVASAAAIGYTTTILSASIGSAVANAAPKAVLDALGSVAVPVQVALMAFEVSKSIGQYLDGEISAQECIQDVALSSICIYAGMVGGLAGGPAGAFVASLVASIACEIIVEYTAISRMTKEKVSRVNALANTALREMDGLRSDLKSMVSTHFKEWDEKVDEGFRKMLTAAMSNDADGIAGGLGTVLSVFGQSVKFKTTEEFDDFFMNEDAVLDF